MNWLNPLRGNGYQFWSGIGATVAPFVVGIAFYFKPTRCEEIGCRRRAQKIHPMNGRQVCLRHLP